MNSRNNCALYSSGTEGVNIKRIIFRFAFASACFLAILILCEVGLRMFAPIHFVQKIRSAREYDPEIGIRKRPAMHMFQTTDFQAESIANSIGTTNFADDFSDYRYLVFAIGDSFTEGSGVPADCSYPFQLDLLLNVDDHGVYHHDYAVVNLGHSGFGTVQQLMMLQRFAERIDEPDFVLLLGCDNDFRDDQVFERGLKHLSYVTGNPNHSEVAVKAAPLVEDVELVKRYFRLRGLMLKKQMDNNAEFPNDVCTAERQSEKLTNISEVCDRMNATLIVSWVTDTRKKHSYEWLKGWAVSQRIGFADYRPGTMELLSSKPRLEMKNHHSTRHFRSWVNNAIARAFAKKIKEPASHELSTN